MGERLVFEVVVRVLENVARCGVRIEHRPVDKLVVAGRQALGLREKVPLEVIAPGQQHTRLVVVLDEPGPDVVRRTRVRLAVDESLDDGLRRRGAILGEPEVSRAAQRVVRGVEGETAFAPAAHGLAGRGGERPPGPSVDARLLQDLAEHPVSIRHAGAVLRV